MHFSFSRNDTLLYKDERVVQTNLEIKEKDTQRGSFNTLLSTPRKYENVSGLEEKFLVRKDERDIAHFIERFSTCR